MDSDPHKECAELTGEDLRWWLALTRSPSLGARGLAVLLQKFPDHLDLLQRIRAGDHRALPGRVRAGLKTPDWRAVDSDLDWAERAGNHRLTRFGCTYPPLLLETADPPPVLYATGELRWLTSPMVAVVGSRRPTPNGAQTAHRFAGALTAAGLTVCSGLAAGIDGAGHAGALAASGATVAVVGTGLDRVYPAAHRRLAADIRAHGAVVSEYPPGTPPRAGHFPRRNRIISGMSLGTLVCEAALRSGSLITARLAAEQGREVFAIPGSIHNPLARGCHALLRDGATLVETVDDVLAELPPLAGALQARMAISGVAPAAFADLPAECENMLRYVDFEPTPVDVLVARSGVTAAAVCAMLLALELQGYVSSAPGGGYFRCTESGERRQPVDYNR